MFSLFEQMITYGHVNNDIWKKDLQSMVTLLSKEFHFLRVSFVCFSCLNIILLVALGAFSSLLMSNFGSFGRTSVWRPREPCGASLGMDTGQREQSSLSRARRKIWGFQKPTGQCPFVKQHALSEWWRGEVCVMSQKPNTDSFIVLGFGLRRSIATWFQLSAIWLFSLLNCLNYEMSFLHAGRPLTFTSSL